MLRSLELSNVLDQFGLNEEARAYNINLVKKTQIMQTFFEPDGVKVEYQTGSWAEGTTIGPLTSDVDLMFSCNNTLLRNRPLIASLEDRCPETENELAFIIRDDRAHRGFVEVEAIGSQDVIPQPIEKFYIQQSDGRMFVSSSSFVGKMQELHSKYSQNLKKFERHGPALSKDFTNVEKLNENPSGRKYGVYSSKTDWVQCLKCPFWPAQAKEWLERRKSYNWPSKEQIKSAEREGCLLVPVGFPGSPVEDKEWRVSFSVQERNLIWSWNTTQVKCYVFLKVFLKRQIQKLPEFKGILPGKLLHSYHLKTLMFWHIENTDPEKWKPENLVSCISEILDNLDECIVSENCPNYFIRDHNLFEGRVNGTVKKLLRAFSRIEQVFLISFMKNTDIFEFSEGKLKMGQQYMNVIKYDQEIANSLFYKEFAESRARMILYLRKESLIETIHAHRDLASHNLGHLKRLAAGGRQIYRMMMRALDTSHGSHLFTLALYTEDEQQADKLFAKALHKLERGRKFDSLSGRTRLAWFYFSINKLDECLKELNEGFNAADAHVQLTSGSHSKYHFKTRPLTSYVPCHLAITDVLGKYYQFETIFESFEFAYLPSVLKFEIAINSGNIIAADSGAFAYFLMFHGYRKLKDEKMVHETLACFGNYFERNQGELSHLCTDLNLLYHCHRLAGNDETACKILLQSLHIEPCYNGAIWSLGCFLHQVLNQLEKNMLV